jgi:two-component system, OmpR family, phosphate regulon sensor histidine kinase PhoR
MRFNIKKTYKFAIISSVYITLFATIFVAILLIIFYKLDQDFNHFGWLLFLLLFAVFMMIFLSLIIQYRAEKFIYQRIKKIYDDISLLENSSFRNQPITTDIDALKLEVKQYASDKKLEIEMLKLREDYRREFLGNVSHELKTPLFTVQGYLSTLLDGAMKDKTVRKKYLERAEKGVERLIYIVQDLDMITKLETGDLHLDKTSFDLIKVIQSVFDLLEMKASKKDIILMFDSKYKSINVFADKEKIQQVVMNLIVNSIKYGREKGTTEVAIEDLNHSKIIIRITDNGEGIEKSNIPRLFERFYRVNKSGSRTEGGSGLGLAIVKHIIEAHNEKIYVESRFAVGSEFSFTLEKEKTNPNR